MAKSIYFRLLFLFLIMISLIGCGSGGSGGGSSVTISGTVQDYSFKYLQGVKIDLSGVAKTVTDQDGNFKTGSFPQGTYTMSFSINGYWTLSFPVTFNQGGDFGFSSTIYLSKVISGQGTVIDPTLITDLINNSELTINTANKVKSFIAVAYEDGSSQVADQTNIAISTDLPSNSLSISQVNKSLGYNRTKPDLYQKLRDFDRKVNQSMLSKGITPGLSQRSLSLSVDPNPEANQKTFYKYNFDANDTFSSVTANLKYNGTKCLIYVDKKRNISDADIQQLGQAFDGNIYDADIQYFGDLTANIDNYNKVYLLLTELPYDDTEEVTGFFDSTNEYSKNQYQYSNEKEMLYLTTYNYNSSQPSAWLAMIKATSAHEFQHLINYSCRVGKGETPTWLNEGLSMVAEDIAISGPGSHNSFLDSYINTYLKYHAYDCLQDWQGDVLDYGSAYMFLRYYADRYGETNLKNINMTSDYYPDTYTLVRYSDTSNFEELYRDWLTAVILDSLGYTSNDSTLTKKYLYKTINLSLPAYDFPKETTGYINIAEGAGAFIYLPNLISAGRIDVAISGGRNVKVRLIMLPTIDGAFASMMNTNTHKIIKLR